MTGRGGSRCKPRTSSHGLRSMGRYLHRGAAVDGGLGDRGKNLHVVYALVERGIARQRVRLINAGDFLEEGACLEDEAIVLANAYTRCIHRQAAREVRVVRTDDHATITPRLIDVADRSLAMADDGAEWHRTLHDRGCESSAAYLLYISAGGVETH